MRNAQTSRIPTFTPLKTLAVAPQSAVKLKNGTRIRIAG